ncbi:MAG: Asp-tRNA(Asn)/Glu-tRNA(Gln) amidotransferase subunit GatA [Planctomycetota bacterium]
MQVERRTAGEIREAVSSGRLSARSVVGAALARIERHDKTIRAFLQVDAQGALAAAEAVDQKVAQGRPVGRLAGVPVAVKDNLCIEDGSASCASRILEDYRPPYTAHVVDRLRAEDAIILGKTNLDEFAMGSSTENSAFGPTRNPWNTSCAPGGSSGGSAAAVAAGFVPLALGSDTGGSIRQPASFCGCVGFKPTYGRVSRYGLVAFGSSLDQIGPLARTARDAALCMSVIAGHDARDATSADLPMPDFVRAVEEGAPRTRIGVPAEYFGDGLDPEVRERVEEAIRILREKGAAIVEIRLPHTRYGIPVYYIVATAEASSNLARYDGVHYGHRTRRADDIISLFSRSREEGFGPEVKRRIMLGTYVLSAGYYDAYYLRALKVRTLIARDFLRAFESVDAILAPTSPTAAFRLGEKAADPLAMYLSDIFTINANLAGIPAVSIPCGEKGGLPVGLQIMGRHFDDARVLALARELEDALPWKGRVAPLD